MFSNHTHLFPFLPRADSCDERCFFLSFRRIRRCSIVCIGPVATGSRTADECDVAYRIPMNQKDLQQHCTIIPRKWLHVAYLQDHRARFCGRNDK